jgi:hypothetical protein
MVLPAQWLFAATLAPLLFPSLERRTTYQRGFTGLGNDNQERFIVHSAVAIAEFRGDIHSPPAAAAAFTIAYLPTRGRMIGGWPAATSHMTTFWILLACAGESLNSLQIHMLASPGDTSFPGFDLRPRAAH